MNIIEMSLDIFGFPFLIVDTMPLFDLGLEREENIDAIMFLSVS